MLLRFNKNLLLKTLLQLKTPKSTEYCKPIVNYCSSSITKLFLQCRSYTSDSSNHVPFPALSDDPLLITPSFLKSIQSVINLQIITKTLDKDFHMNDFVKGSRQALCVVSRALAREDYESIKELVNLETIDSLSKKIGYLNSKQKQLIAVRKDDISATFPYEIEIIKDVCENKERDERKIVRITVVYHLIPDKPVMKNLDDMNTIFDIVKNSFPKNCRVANYRFVRDYTDGIESSWKINRINHFMLDPP